MDIEYLFPLGPTIHDDLSTLRTVTRARRAFARFDQLEIASSTQQQWMTFLTAIEFGSVRLGRNPNFRELSSQAFLDAVSDNATAYGLDLFPERVVSALFGRIGRLAITAASIECIEECYKRHRPKSRELYTCLARCYRR